MVKHFCDRCKDEHQYEELKRCKLDITYGTGSMCPPILGLALDLCSICLHELKEWVSKGRVKDRA
jgi:hypothetical protein